MHHTQLYNGATAHKKEIKDKLDYGVPPQQRLLIRNTDMYLKMNIQDQRFST